jgi:hypothetical protein
MNMDSATEPAWRAPPMVAVSAPMKMDFLRPRRSASHDEHKAPMTGNRQSISQARHIQEYSTDALLQYKDH